jgi:DNA repair protein RadC
LTTEDDTGTAPGTLAYTTMIRDLPQGERPRERLQHVGPGSLSNSELIAILLRTGSGGESVLGLATRLLSQYGGLARMARVSFGELCSIKGISEAKASQVLAAFEIGRRLVSLTPEDRTVVRSPRDVANLLSAEMGFLSQEHLRVVLLSSKNEILGVHEVYIGNVNSSIVRVAEVLRPAVRENCPAIIVVHNHPSGDPSPSPEDVLITRKIAAGAEMIDLELLDHIIIGGQSFVSLKDKKLGFGG